MIIVTGGCYLYYFPSLEALKVISEWDGALIVWETDDASGRPHAVHLKPAFDGRSGRKITRYNGDRILSIPTSAVGLAVGPRSQFVEEIEVSPNLISVKLPFEFQPT